MFSSLLLRGCEEIVCFFQVFPYAYLLGAFLLTYSALDALVGTASTEGPSSK